MGGRLISAHKAGAVTQEPTIGLLNVKSADSFLPGTSRQTNMDWSPDIPLFGGVHFSPDAPDPDNITVIDHNCLPMIHDMHRYGIRIDVPYLQSLSTRLHGMQAEIEEEVGLLIGDYQYTHAKHGRQPFNISSRDHLAQLLFEELEIQGHDPVPMTPKGKRFGVSEEILKPFSKRHPIVPSVVEWHSIDKLLNTYVDVLPLLVDSDSRLHTSFNPTVAATGRLSSSDPNLQNIPIRTELGKLIRAAFIASVGCQLGSTDLSQIEMVWAAHRSQDPVMMAVFQNKEDIHTRTACNVFNDDYDKIIALQTACDNGTATKSQQGEWKLFKSIKRLPCKTVGFGVLYGQTAKGLVESLASDGVFWTEGQCQDFIDNKFFAVYKKLKAMLERDYRTAYRYAMIWDDFGRVRLVPEAKSKIKKIANEGTRKAGNHPEQGGAQETIKIGMAKTTPIYKDFIRKGIKVHPLLQIHDQLIFDVQQSHVKEFIEIAAENLRTATPLKVPVGASADIGERWLDL